MCMGEMFTFCRYGLYNHTVFVILIKEIMHVKCQEWIPTIFFCMTRYIFNRYLNQRMDWNQAYYFRSLINRAFPYYYMYQ